MEGNFGHNNVWPNKNPPFRAPRDRSASLSTFSEDKPKQKEKQKTKADAIEIYDSDEHAKPSPAPKPRKSLQGQVLGNVELKKSHKHPPAELKFLAEDEKRDDIEISPSKHRFQKKKPHRLPKQKVELISLVSPEHKPTIIETSIETTTHQQTNNTNNADIDTEMADWELALQIEQAEQARFRDEELARHLQKEEQKRVERERRKQQEAQYRRDQAIRRMHHMLMYSRGGLDVDNMSYEQLLELGEKIGNVKKSGLSKGELKTLKAYQYNPSKEQTYNTNCSICLSDFDEGESVKTLGCNHTFHDNCIDKWLLQKESCPICQKKVIE